VSVGAKIDPLNAPIDQDMRSRLLHSPFPSIVSAPLKKCSGSSAYYSSVPFLRQAIG
jgi:hypothetical protein